MTDFPLCKAAGLTVYRSQINKHPDVWADEAVRASDVEAYLFKTFDKIEKGYEAPSGVFKDPELSERLRNVTYPPWADEKTRPNFGQFADAVRKKMDYSLDQGCTPKGDDRMSKADNEFFKTEDFPLPLDITLLNQYALPKYCADTANRLLKERSKPVFGRVDGDFGWFDTCNLRKTDGFKEKTHQALLIQMQPIEKEDTAESLVKEMIQELGRRGADTDWLERAKRLLNKE